MVIRAVDSEIRVFRRMRTILTFILIVVYNTPSGPDLNLALKLALLTTDAPDSFTLDDLKLYVFHASSLSSSNLTST